MSTKIQPRLRAKVLVSDDDNNVRMLTRQCLEAEDISVVEASNGLETLDMFVRERPDLIFLDVEMPGMSGLEVCQRIRQMPQGASVPIMIVTGSDDCLTIDKGFEAGATQYKVKPVNWALLSRDVHYMLRASNAFNALKRQEDRLRYLAYFDPLTSLPNRRSFNEQLTRILKRSQRRNSHAALLFIDLDHFKRINDSIGHGRGDRLLVEIAKRLNLELRADDAIGYFYSDDNREDGDTDTEIARLGGDEFTVVLSDIPDVAHVEQIAQRVLKSLSQPIALQSHNPIVTPSIGIALYPQDGHDADSLVRNADTAMYVAKAGGRACYRFYSEEMNARAVDQLKMEEELRHALRKGTLYLHYQPQISSHEGRVVGFEALARWEHPIRGCISPLEFIPVAEHTGLIIELGEWVFTEVIKQLQYMDALGVNNFHISVNISPIQFKQDNLAERLADILIPSGLAPNRIELELTESAIMTGAESNISKLRALKDIGLSLAVDDFGTGYSSLAYLKRFPIDTLKIDQGFVKDIESTDGAAIVDAILALADSMRLRVVAEGIESASQLNYLLARNCDLLQGYYLSYPKSPDVMRDEVIRSFNYLMG
ncbi:MAG: EAL domain-containing protein [Parahaliea sp.]